MPIRVMIVEDNTTVAKDLQGCLNDLGYEVTSLQVSGEEAIVKAGSECPDIVIMDIHLRGQMTGIEAAEIIHDQFEIPLIFLSAYSDRNLLEKAKQVGAFGYLVKPFEERELFANIEMAIYKFKVEKERRESEFRLAQIEKLEGFRRMASSLAHNFNNILQVPMGCNELIKDLLPSSPQCQELIQDSTLALKRAAKISELMLIYVGQGTDKFMAFNLASEIRIVTDSMRKKLPAQHSLEIKFESTDTVINANSEHLQKLLEHLLINASEAIGDGHGEISLSTQVVSGKEAWLQEVFENNTISKKNSVIIRISDNGCGMDEDTRAKIFDPFFSTKFLGRGLGMAAALGIVERHNGAITVKSQTGKGTEVIIAIPCPEH